MSTKVPNCGWKVKFNHSFPEKRNQFFIPSFKILFNLFTLLIRYVHIDIFSNLYLSFYTIYCKEQKNLFL